MTTKRACVIGWPAKHSRSPKLHGYWIKKHGIDGDYRIEEVKPEDFAAFVKNLAGHGYVGCNITMPHKDAAFQLSEPDERAKGEVTIKDLIEGAQAATAIKDNKEWKEARPAQVAVSESNMVEEVRKIISRHS